MATKVLNTIGLVVLLALTLTFSACSSVDTQDEDDLAALDGGEVDSDVMSDSNDASDESDFESQDVAAEDKKEEAAPEKDLSEELEETKPQEETVVEEAPPQLEPQVEPAPQVAETPVPIVEKPVAQNLAEVTQIKYLANQKGGSVVIETSEPTFYQSRVNKENNQFIVEISKARLPKTLQRPYIMKDFDGIFKQVNAYQKDGATTARVVIQMRSAEQPIIQQEGNSIIVIPSSEQMSQAKVSETSDTGTTPEAEVDGEKKEAWHDSYDIKAASKSEKILGARTLDEFLTGNNRFFGRPISMQVKDTDIRDVINFIAEESGLNIVLSDDVTGNISLKLRQVPWDQALVIVMRAKELGYIRQGNVLRISTLKTLQSESDTAKRIIDAQKELAPIRVKVIPVSFAKVDDMVKQVDSFLTKGRGHAVSDNRTSSLIITDTDDVIAKLSRLIRELDIPPAQVMIESKIIEAAENFTKSVGVVWNLRGAQTVLSPTGGANKGPINMTSSLSVQPITDSTVQGGMGVFSLNVGTLDFLGDLSAALALAERDNMVKIISSPRIVTINKEKAEISQAGENVTIQSTVDLQSNKITKTATRTPVELKLSVTPQITNDGSVILEVDLKRQFVGAVEDSDTLARAINTRQANTKVLVKNGQTAVIGGIYQNDTTESDTGVPGLKNIPIFGWLFKAKQTERNKNELLLFLTPRILNLQDQSADTPSTKG